MPVPVGGDTSNTPPQTLQNPFPSLNIAPSVESTGGEDWFEVCLYLRWDAERFQTLSKQLDAHKEEAATAKEQAGSSRAYKGRAKPFHMLPGSAGRWIVAPTGGRLGDRDKGPVLRWLLERDGVRFGLMNRSEPHETLPSGFVRFTGETLMAVGGAEQAWALVTAWFAELGAEITDTRVSRVDLAADLPGVGVEALTSALREGRVITRVKRTREDSYCEFFGTHTKSTGFRLGSGSLLRVYDKALECRDIAKRAWMIERRWGGVDQDKALRVEFQLRRDFLGATKVKGWDDGTIARPQINTVEDYFEFRNELVEYLTSKWVRFVEPGFDRRHTERAVDLPVWTQAVEQFRAWVGKPVELIESLRFPRLRRSLIDCEPLAKQIRGCAERMASLRRMNIGGPDDFLGFLNEQVWKVIELDTDIPERIKSKTCELGSLELDDEPNWGTLDMPVPDGVLPF